MPSVTTDQLLSMSEADLLRQCRVEFYKSGGPGGQKRNKTTSAARVVHPASGLSGQSGDFRSQAQNRVRALHRLRMRLAVELRTPVEIFAYAPPAWMRPYTVGGQLHVNEKNPDFARVAAHLLDLLHACDADIARVAALSGVSTSSLNKWLGQHDGVWTAVSGMRRSGTEEKRPQER